MIKLKNIDKTYHKNKANALHVIDDTSLELPNKGLIVLLGKSGSGKTTLLNVLGGLDKADKGEIDFFGTSMTKYNAKKWDQIRSQDIGYIFQNYYLLPNLSIFQNVSYVLKMIGIEDEEEIKEKVSYVLKAVGLFPYRRKKALQLSGGQQQRAAIARALVKNPKVIIADEPTGNLDSKNTVDIMNILKVVSKDRLVVLVTHDEKIAEYYADRIIRIKDGKVMSDESNQTSIDHDLNSDDAIYLKDLKALSKVNDGSLKASYYSDQEEIIDLNINLVLKNNTLYIDLNDFKNRVVILDEESPQVIKDEHYKPKTKQEVTETKFDAKILERKQQTHTKKLHFNFKKLLLNIVERLTSISRRGKFVILSLFLAGGFLAFATSILTQFYLPRPEKQLTWSPSYVKVEPERTYGQINNSFYDYLNQNEQLRNNIAISPAFSGRDNLVYLLNGSSIAFNHIESVMGLNPSKIIHGQMPTTFNQVLISENFGQENHALESIGIRDIRYLIGETITFQNQEFIISGIVKELKSSVIYMTNQGKLSSNEKLPYDFYDENAVSYNLNLTYNHLDTTFIKGALSSGRMPQTSSEVVLPSQLESIIKDRESYFFEPYEVVGYYDDPSFNIIGQGFYIFSIYFKDYITAELNYLKNKEEIYFFNNQWFITSSLPKTVLMDELKKFSSPIDQIAVVDLYQLALEMDETSRSQSMTLVFPILLVLTSVSLLGFYFLNKSSLYSKIYPVGVLRSLGVNKLEVSFDFIMEIIFMITISALPGFIAGSYLISVLKETFPTVPFDYTWYSIILGVFVVYTLFLVIGYLPMYLLLRKTPAEIITKYDI